MSISVLKKCYYAFFSIHANYIHIHIQKNICITSFFKWDFKMRQLVLRHPVKDRKKFQ